MPGRRKPDPDGILCARLSGTAIRLARAGDAIDEAVAELRELAAGVVTCSPNRPASWPACGRLGSKPVTTC
jgi:hypothetical protein